MGGLTVGGLTVPRHPLVTCAAVCVVYPRLGRPTPSDSPTTHVWSHDPPGYTPCQEAIFPISSWTVGESPLIHSAQNQLEYKM